jgi:tetratricopeptide (TPR) repeat protein
MLSQKMFRQENERSAAASPSSVATSSWESENDVVPFFIMDFLEHMDPQSIALAQKLLEQKPRPRNSILLPTLSRNQDGSDDTPSIQPRDEQEFNITPSPFLQRSIQIGNKYNARGIEKAQKGDWDAALKHWKDALEIRSQIYGPSHIDVANVCNNIGIAYGKLHQYSNALLYLHRAFDIRIEQGYDEVATTLHNIGNIYQQMNELTIAIQYFVQCKRLQEEMVPTPHMDVARTCIAIGHTYCLALAYDDAREAFGDAVAIFEELRLPLDHPEYAATLADVQAMEGK